MRTIQLIYCYDIDGTICTNTDGDYDSAEPFPHIIAQVNKHFESGNKIVFFTARGSTTDIDWRPLTESQLSEWGVKYHELHFGKPHADVFFDDKTINPWLNPGRTELGVKPPAKPPTSEQLTADRSPGIMGSAAYLDVTYASNRVTKSSYPSHLTKHLYDRFLNRPGSLLDVGCGQGEHLHGFAKTGLEVQGVDASPRSVEQAKPHLVHLLNLDKEPLPFFDETFDFIFSKSVIEHLHKPVELLTEIKRVLRPGGTALIMTPSWVHTAWGPFYIDHTHKTPFTRPSLEDALCLAGFQNPDVREFRQLPFLWKNPSYTPLVKLLSWLPLPYRPMDEIAWPDRINTLIRFSKEVMLLGIVRK